MLPYRDVPGEHQRLEIAKHAVARRLLRVVALAIDLSVQRTHFGRVETATPQPAETLGPPHRLVTRHQSLSLGVYEARTLLNGKSDPLEIKPRRAGPRVAELGVSQGRPGLVREQGPG